MAIYQVVVTHNQQNLGIAQNKYWFEAPPELPGNPLWLAAVGSWMDAIYSPLQSSLDSGFVSMGVSIDMVDNDGSVLTHMGTTNPAISGTNAGDQLALTTALTLTARTFAPKIRGSKRIGGAEEGTQKDGLFLNGMLTAGVTAAIQWVLGPAGFGIAGAQAGVLSRTYQAFYPFTGSLQVTNIPGTQVTRKPGRGA